MKTQNRISDFRTLDVMSQIDLSFADEDRHGIIVLLTNEVERQRSNLEKLYNMAQGKKKIRRIELIIDHIPYQNNFITLPNDLTPMRDRINLELAWNSIEQDLQTLFPASENPQPDPQPEPQKDNRNLKLAGASIATFSLCVAFFAAAYRYYIAFDYVVPIFLYSALLPILVFFRHKRTLEIPKQDLKRIEPAIDWRQLFIRTGGLLLVLLVSFVIWYSVTRRVFMSSMLSVIISLGFLLYKGKSQPINVTVEGNGEMSQSKSLLKYGGGVLFLSAMFWTAIILYAGKDIERSPAPELILGMSAFTTILLVTIRQVRNRAKRLVKK